VDPNNPPYVGTETRFTANFTTQNWSPANRVNRAVFTITNNATGATVASRTDSDYPYDITHTFLPTPLSLDQHTVSVIGYFDQSGSQPCERNLTFTPNLPRVTIVGRVCETDVNNKIGGVPCTHNGTFACPTLSQPFSDSISLINATPSLAAFSTQSLNVTNSSNVATFSDIFGRNGTYSLYIANNSSDDWYFQTPQNHNLFSSSWNQNDIITRNFCVTLQNDPWWQTAFGDTFAEGDLISPIPANPTSGALFSRGDGTKSPGVPVVGGSTINLGPIATISDSNYRARNTESRTIQGVEQPYNWFGYFKRTYEIVQQSNSTFTNSFPGNPFVLTHGLLIYDNAVKGNRIMDAYPEEAVYYLNNDAIIEENFNVPELINGVTKHTIFINGDLTVSAPQIQTAGKFLGFIVTGNITFTGTTKTIEGVYITNARIIIDDAPDSDNTDIGRQFRGFGTFVGQSGVILARNLESPSNVLANNLNPAELFTYRPDFVANAPRGLKRIPIKWREIKPQPLPQ
jgi:hypothetical protein